MASLASFGSFGREQRADLGLERVAPCLELGQLAPRQLGELGVGVGRERASVLDAAHRLLVAAAGLEQWPQLGQLLPRLGELRGLARDGRVGEALLQRPGAHPQLSDFFQPIGHGEDGNLRDLGGLRGTGGGCEASRIGSPLASGRLESEIAAV